MTFRNQILTLLVPVMALLTPFNLVGQQVSGCTDAHATNFNPAAQVDDGSCTYPLYNYNPLTKFLLPKEVEETSGLAFFNGKLWTINDSGGLPTIYGLDTLTGEVLQRIAVSNATNVDWESLAQDDAYLYVGDFGNNSGNRNNLLIYKILLTEIPAKGDGQVVAESIRFSYEDYVGPIAKRKDNNFDCEAFIADGDSLYLFSKNWENQQCRLYRLPKTPGTFIAQKLASFDTKGLVTGADINPRSGELILTGYTNKTWIPFMWVFTDYADHQYFSGNKQRVNMINLPATQVEAIAFTRGRRAVITSEGHVLFSQTAFSVNTGQWNEAGNEDKLSLDTFEFRIRPNPAKGKKITLSFENIVDNPIQITILDDGDKEVNPKKEPVIKNKKGETRAVLNINHLQPGNYTIRVIIDGKKVEKPLTIQ